VHGVRGGEPFGYAARLGGISACLESEDTFDMVHNLVDTPLERCRDIFAHGGSPSLGCDDVFHNSLENVMFLLCVHNLHFPLGIPLMCQKIFSKLCDFNVDMAMRITSLIYLVKMLKILSP